MCECAWSYLYAWKCVCHSTQRHLDNSKESVPLCWSLGQSQAVSPGDKCLSPLSRLTVPDHNLHIYREPCCFSSPQVVFVVLAFLTGVPCLYPNPTEDKCPENYTSPLKVQTAIILGKLILWILHLLFERYVQYHHRKVRSRGYSQIYRSTRHLKTLALTIHSSGEYHVSLIFLVVSLVFNGCVMSPALNAFCVLDFYSPVYLFIQ